MCRVFGGGSSSSSLNQEPTKKRLIDEVNSTTNITERNKFPKTDDDLQFQPTSMSLSVSHSYTSISTRSPPPSPITHSDQSINRQSSMSFHTNDSSLPIQSMMVTQINSILDNIDSVLDKIEAQTNSVIRRPAFNENYASIGMLNSQNSNVNVTEQLVNTSAQPSTDQITQTAINIVEHHVNMNDGSGDTAPRFIDLLDIMDESSSILSSESSEDMIDDFL